MATFSAEQVAAYLARVGHSCSGSNGDQSSSVLQLPPPSLHTLVHLQRAHLLVVPFENLSLRLPAAAAQHGCSTDLVAIFEKVVLSRRGAYCFEVGA
jgi:arylamine N-acetyltransferase